MEEIATLATPESTAVETTPTETTTETPTETPAPETPAADTPAETEDEPELPGDPGEDQGAIETDARTMDKQTREIISALKKTNPVAAKLLAKQFYGRQAYEKEFPTVQDARQAKATIESLGGEEGISKLNEEVSDYRQEIEQFAKGDPALVEQLYKGNPESTVKMVEAALDIFQQNNNLNALDQVLMGPMVKRLQDVGLHTHLLKAAELLKEGDGQGAYDKLGEIGQWLAKLTEDAKKLSTTRTVKDPREEQFARERQELDREKRETFDNRIAVEVNELNNRALSKVIGNFFREVNLDQEGKKEFTHNLQQRIWKAMREDRVFQRQAHAVKARGDQSGAAQFINAKFAELAPSIFRRYKNTMYPSLSRAAAKSNGTAAAAANGKPAVRTAAATGGPIKVADAPAFDEVDWAKTPDTLWVRGQAHLKNGKHVTFY